MTTGTFGDPRPAAARGSLTVRTIGEARAGEMAVHRFLGSPELTVEEILATCGEWTAAA